MKNISYAFMEKLYEIEKRLSQLEESKEVDIIAFLQMVENKNRKEEENEEKYFYS